MIILTAEGIREVNDSYGRRMIEQGKAIPAPEEAEAPTEQAETATAEPAKEEPATPAPKKRKKG